MALPSPLPPLVQSIRDEIVRSGPIPFRRFMERALYDPAHGYYAGGRAAIGREGDYFTNVSVGPLFGRLLAGQFEAMWRGLGEPARFDVVEQGANNGDFARDLLRAAEGEAPDFYAALRYRIVEPFPVNEARQRERLARWAGEAEGKISWRRSLEELPAFIGVHFSNELLDAMPVHRLVCRDGVWLERYVGLASEGDPFAWETGPLSAPELASSLPMLPAIEGYETEVNLAALEWVRTLAPRLERGYVLVADYGFSRRDFYLPERTGGTLTGYRQHRRCDDPLAFVGDQDLTAHVEFTTLAETAERAGLTVAGFADQHHFMVGLGKRAFPDASAPLTAAEQRERRAYAALMHPTLMGRGFQFLALARDAPESLHGFEFAGDSRAKLGLF